MLIINLKTDLKVIVNLIGDRQNKSNFILNFRQYVDVSL